MAESAQFSADFIYFSVVANKIFLFFFLNGEIVAKAETGASTCIVSFVMILNL